VHVCGHAVAALTAAYGFVLVAGLLGLPSPEHPIQDPWFTAMELLILVIAPAAVVFSAGLQVAVPAHNQAAARLAVVFMSLCAVLTCSVHFSILTLSRAEPFASAAWAPQVFAFRWPSVAYALDILAWDLFFAAGCVCTALALRRLPGAAGARRLMLAAGALSLAGVLGVVVSDMGVRNIGIVGYALVYPLATAWLGRLARPLRSPGTP